MAEALTNSSNKGPKWTISYNKEPVATGVEAPANEETVPTVLAENTGKRRKRLAICDANDPNLIANDVEGPTSTPKVEKSDYSTFSAKEFTKQINWIVFGNSANWTNTTTEANEETALQVGLIYKKRKSWLVI